MKPHLCEMRELDRRIPGECRRWNTMCSLAGLMILHAKRIEHPPIDPPASETSVYGKTRLRRLDGWPVLFYAFQKL